MKKIVLSGSKRFIPKFFELEEKLKAKGYEVVNVEFNVSRGVEIYYFRLKKDKSKRGIFDFFKL